MKAIPTDVDVRVRSRKVPIQDENGEWESIEVQDLVATTPFRTRFGKSQIAALKARMPSRGRRGTAPPVKKGKK